MPENQSDSTIDLRWLVSTLWRRKWILILCGAAGLAIGAYNVSRQTPVYMATASLLFEPERLQLVDLADVLADQDSNATLANQLQIINSTTLLERVVGRLEDEEAPAAPAAAEDAADGDAEDGSVLARIEAWGAGRVEAVNRFLEARGATYQIPLSSAEVDELEAAQPSAEEIAAQAHSDALATLRNHLDIGQISGSRVIEVDYSGADPAYAAKVANIVGEEYISFQQELKNQDVTAVIDLMNTRITGLREQLQASETALEKARLDLYERQPQSAEMTSIQLNALNEELVGIRLQLVAAQARHKRASEALASDEDLWSVSEFRDSALIQDFRRRELELKEADAQESAITGKASTPAKAVNAAVMQRIHEGIREEAGYIVEALDFEVSSLQRREDEMEGMIRDLEVVAIEQSVDAMQTERLAREVQANQTLYQSFVDRLKEITEQARLQSADARFLSRAEAPSRPDRSRSMRALMIAGIAGGAIGLFLVLILEKATNAFRTTGELSRATGLPVIGAVPQSGRLLNARDLAARFSRQPRGLFGECIRNLRTSMLYSDPGNTPEVVMFTSSVPGEGKSSTTLLVGISSQQAGRRTIVLSCDLRDNGNAKLYASLSKDSPEHPKVGLLSLLRGDCTLDEAVRTEPRSGLHYLAVHPSERVLESPADLLAMPRFADLIAELRQDYDLVLLDTPPALAVTDARLMARHVDKVVYLVRWNSTQRNAVVEGLREVRSMGVAIAGCAFTRVSQRKAAQYSDNEFLYRRSYAAYYR
ncbi:Wzz/FepE/Etk N-terminal domain-containing protein [Poseidonocella sp. HB161398]|uniref:GumC family protein n=1 Tax=Poseidonocella sp. HB161398 TaxID=2320855 RepID=UPI0014865AE7|nr:Wzz/FepE/Etk N-terminal domain-containing protein [Poseidonocella sp. HB161398]